MISQSMCTLFHFFANKTFLASGPTTSKSPSQSFDMSVHSTSTLFIAVYHWQKTMDQKRTRSIAGLYQTSTMHGLSNGTQEESGQV